MAAPMAGKVATFSLCNATRIAVKRAKIIQVHSRCMGLFDKLKVFQKKNEIEKLKKESQKTALIEDIAEEPEPVDKRIGIEERRAYMPPNDVVEKIKAAAESIYGPSENWQDVELTSRIKKFDFVTKLMSDLNHEVSSMGLHEMRTVGDVVRYFQTPVKNSSNFDELSKLNLPKNLHLNLEYIRFHPETDKIHGGYTAFPGRATKVTSLKYRRKYIGYDGGDPINDPESLTRFK